MNRSSRRQFLATAGASMLTSVPALARADSAGPRILRFDHLHTGEKLVVAYFQADRYLPDALAAVNHLLRDFRTGDVGAMAPALLDLLHRLGTLTGSTQAFQIISGYRSPATNAALRERSSGVASGSLHMQGQAIDVRLPGVALPALRDAALALRAGGVGYYAASNFVHLDCGRVRAW